MSREVKVAVIGAIATIVAAIIGGIFLLINTSDGQPKPSPDNTSIIDGGTTANYTATILNSTGSTIEETLTNYCQALEQNDAQTAYDQFSSNYKKRYSLSEFQRVLNNANNQAGGVSQCTYSNVQESTSTGSATVTIELASGITKTSTFYLIRENDVWKIENTT
jgi:hypothetical protein